MSSILKQTFGEQRRWVIWKLEKVGGKMTKIPYNARGGHASSTDHKTWSTYDEAKAKSENIGIMFGLKGQLLGIDIDHCLKNGEIEHEQKDKIEALIKEADTYCELSPSKTGLHLFLFVDDGIQLVANKKSPFEIYSAKRYFTVTEQVWGEEKEIRIVSRETAEKILAIIGYPWGKSMVDTIAIDGKLYDNAMKATTPIPLDSVLLEKMFASKGGKKIKSLYDGSTTDYNNDDSSADMALLSHLAFWTGKDPVQMERIWLASPLGQRGKTQERKDYRDRTINAAIANCKDVYEAPAVRTKKKVESATIEEAPEFKFEDLNLLTQLNAKKDIVYIQNVENICRVLRIHPAFKGHLRFDIFRNLFEIKKNNKWEAFEDVDIIHIQTKIQILFPCFIKVGKEMVYDAMLKVFKENKYDSAADYLSNLKWDGTVRIDTWLKSVYGVEDNEYHRAVGSNWLKGLVKRIIEPGCKFDYVLVLEGEQGSKKSTSLGVLGGDWHVETTMSTDNKDFFMQMQGKAIVEFSEGETLSRTEVKRMKAIITMQSDKYRPPYERVSQDFPRRCVFAMTTNQEEYLKDETGNRRWLPVAVKMPQADVEWLKENRDQLLAEAYERVIVQGEKIYEFPKEATLEEQAKRQIKDSNTDLVVDWYYNKLDQKQRYDGITIHQVYRDAINNNFMSKGIDKRDEMAIANILRSMGLEKRRRMQNGMQLNRWFPKDAPEVAFGTEIPADDLEHFVSTLKLSDGF